MWHPMGYWIIRTIFQIIAYIPLSFGRFTGKMLGAFISIIPIARLRVSRENIKKTLGASMTDSEAAILNRGVYKHFGQTLFELAHIFRINKKNLDKYVVFEGQENLTRALSKGKGVFILSAHLGNWEMITAAISIRFGGLCAVATPQHAPAVDRLINAIRTRSGMEIIPKKNSIKKMISEIRQNKMVGILLDLNTKWEQGVFVDFLGRPSCTNKGLALIALKMDTPVIPVFSVREEDGLYHILMGEEVKLIRTGDRTIDIEENTALFTRIIEAQVKRYPDQWLWIHRRWKTLPYCPLPD
jgi:Kdo2-lipid IVA lauroyltransferase/acyltransferase